MLHGRRVTPILTTAFITLGRVALPYKIGLFLFFLNHHCHFPAQLVGFTLSKWTSRGHRCRPFSPPVRAFNFYRA